MLVSACFQCVTIYAYEFYSTKIRELANGFLFACTRLGGFSSQFLGVGLDSIYVFLPYYVIACFAFVSSILMVFLPHDTFGHHLDVNIDKEENVNLMKEETEVKQD